MIYCRNYRSIFPLTPKELRRLAFRIEESANECWLWTGAVGAGGYGCVRLRGSTWQVHRMIYELLVGPVPTDSVLHHGCRNKRCCNPAHQEPGTQGDNVKKDAAARGDRPPRKLKKFCVNGHELTDDNVILRSTGGRTVRLCRICRAAREAARHRRNKLRKSAERASRPPDAAPPDQAPPPAGT